MMEASPPRYPPLPPILASPPLGFPRTPLSRLPHASRTPPSRLHAFVSSPDPSDAAPPPDTDTSADYPYTWRASYRQS